MGRRTKIISAWLLLGFVLTASNASTAYAGTFAYAGTLFDESGNADNEGEREFVATEPSTVGPTFDDGSSLATAIWRLGDDEPVVLRGYAADRSFRLGLPPGWASIGDPVLDINPTVSEIARADTSLVIDVDGRPIDTWSHGDGSVAESIDRALFHNGFDLTLETTTPLQNEVPCSDPRHVARWIDAGLPTVRASISPIDLDVGRAISGIGQVSVLTGEAVSVQLLDPTDADAVEALGHVVAAISHHEPPIGWNVLTNEADQTPLGALVVIDTTGNGPAIATVEVVTGRPVVRLSGEGADVVALADAMADPDRLLFFNQDEITLADVPAARAPSIGEVFTFSDGGYDDRTVRGFGQRALIYRVHIPAGAPPDSATLALYATHSPILGNQEATVTVQINGSAEEIVSVLDSSGQLDVLHTVTPADLRPGLNYVTIEAELGSAPTDRCSSGPANWLTVANATTVGVNRDAEPVPVRIGVEDARFVLATAIDFDATDVAIPNRYSTHDLNVAAQLIAELSSRAQGGSPRLVNDAAVDESNHLVIVGPGGNRSLLGGVPYLDGDASVGVIAAVASPYENGRVFLVFSGGDHEASMNAIGAGMSADVNDIATPYALVGPDSIRQVEGGATATDNSEVGAPAQLAFDESGRVVGPTPEQYEDWILGQADRIEAARAPEQNQRRSAALVFGLLAAAIAAFWWLRRTRSNADVESSH